MPTATVFKIMAERVQNRFLSHSISLSDGDRWRRGNFFIIRTMYALGFGFKDRAQWNRVWQEAIELGLTTYNELEDKDRGGFISNFFWITPSKFEIKRSGFASR
jgi:hypothetical protein